MNVSTTKIIHPVLQQSSISFTEVSDIAFWGHFLEDMSVRAFKCNDV